jgi:hypothetical protein
MAVSRRSFLAGIVTTFGVTTNIDLLKKIQDIGKPIILNPPVIENILHVYEGGTLVLGDLSLCDIRPTWRELLLEEGWAVNDPDQIPQILSERGMTTEEELDQSVCDECWEMAYGVTWSPMARAVRLLKRLKIGSNIILKNQGIGQLNFCDGDVHPGSNNVWASVEDDLSVTLLQARLIELNQPTKIIMQIPSLS